jgi:hypothetical protein
MIPIADDAEPAEGAAVGAGRAIHDWIGVVDGAGTGRVEVLGLRRLGILFDGARSGDSEARE